MRLLLLLLTVSASTAAAAVPTLDDVLAEDASLRDVTFVDALRGWAVGDRGLVLRTTDGGERWRRVPTPTDWRLDSVTFLGAELGWAVGGRARPYTHESRGVVLATTNGGRDWEAISDTSLPRLRAVRFFDRKHGVAAGDGTALNPAGVFTTDDGGRHWRPVPGGEARQWLAGDFTRDRLGGLAGVVAGLRGAAARVAGRQVDLTQNTGDRRGGYGVALADAAHGWLVGDGGLVRTTDDGGQAWNPPPRDPPASLQDWFDWRAVATEGERVWIAGAPGSVVLSSADGGSTWNTASTGVTTPLTALTFVDANRGWAVGELGVVITTRDGGLTWRVQRGEGRRAAAGFLAATTAELPTELVSLTAAAEGYRTTVAAPLLSESPTAAGPTAARLSDAAEWLGADATQHGWSVPLEPADAGLPLEPLLARLDRQTDGRTHQLLVEGLRRWLLCYRPDAVVLPEGSGPAELLAAACREAIDAAAVTPPPETRLASWRVRRLVSATADPTEKPGPGEARLGTGDFSALLGATPAQWRRDARGLLAADYRAAPAIYGLQTLFGSPAPGPRAGDLLAGIGLRRGDDARRPAAMATTNGLDQLRRVAAKRRNLERLLEQQAGDPAWAGQVVNLTGGLDAASGADLLRQLAEGYREAGRYELAAETLYLLARRYPEAPLADASLLWLIRYYASGERAWADGHGQGVEARGGAKTLSNVAGGAGALAKVAAPDASGVLSTEERLERAAALIGFLKQARPSLYAQPAVRFADAATQRSRGYGTDADKIALILSKRSIAEDWRRAAEAERWLAKPEGLPPEKPIANCRFTPRRPKLDGRLDEPAWQNARSVALANGPLGEPNTTVRFTHDELFLYVFIEARSHSPQSIEPYSERPRDGDLSPHDRLRLRIDTDRDYATAFELTIDHRGWTADTLWSDPHWRPTWYVAADTADGAWHAEAAIPLAELADPEHLTKAAWAVSLQRLTPGEGATAWPAASDHDSPDAFGLLLFD